MGYNPGTAAQTAGAPCKAFAQPGKAAQEKIRPLQLPLPINDRRAQQQKLRPLIIDAACAEHDLL
ncbi:MAG: hypothetical protein BWK76_18590, partial [Desulfobulbaceae bacterium A2]